MTKQHVEQVEIGRLFVSPSNPRKNDAAVEHVAASIHRFGFRSPIVAKPSGEVIAGNTRLKAAQSLGLETVPVHWFDGSDIEATAYGIADNRTHEFSEWDSVELTTLLEVLRNEDSLEGVGFSESDIDAMMATLSGPEYGDESTDAGLGEISFSVVIEDLTEQRQSELITRFEGEGLKCRALMQ